jgi:hypothetical protein
MYGITYYLVSEFHDKEYFFSVADALTSVCQLRGRYTQGGCWRRLGKIIFDK